jgi:hypothetical protein
MDESYKVAITRLGMRIRVGGTAEVSGYSNTAASRAPRHARSFPDLTCSRTAAIFPMQHSGLACAR